METALTFTMIGVSTVAASTSTTITSTSQATSSAVQASSTGPTTTAITPVASQAPKLPSEIVGKNVEQIIRDWNNELQDRTAKFRKHATAISEWDRRILQNRNVLIRLEAEVAKVVETQTSLERQLELIETHQKEVDKALQSMEEEAERVFQDERLLLREDEAASARDTMFEQSETVENELQHMTEQVKSIIQTLNATQGAEFETADSMTPFDVAVRILDNQLRSLMWIDEKANEFSSRIQRLPNNSAAAERDSGMPRFWLS
uniref:Nucleoporin NSP1-like C-terminal domain-containing protein n=1 Tax=Oryza meridionalis TaxID=40149 RepID=A0A0E0CAH5_9ORYZ